ncbi:MAG: DUF5671 domain-containing protein [Patescibacteria group bacterium]
MTEINKNMPRDTFMYLAAMITLVAVAVGFGMAVFNYIDFYFPDPAVDYYRSPSSYESPIRQAMAMLIIVFPVFFLISRFLRNDVRLNPEKKEFKIRKWFLNLTLFVAALVIAGDFIAVINNFLGGELTIRFALKALTMFFISGSVFYYYFAQLKEIKWINAFSWVITATVITAVLGGFAVIGSPFQQRNKRFDEIRVNDLSAIQNYITNYWQNEGILPANLSDLDDSLSGIVVPVDPETGGMYEYRIINELTFELCATFVAESTDDQRAVPQIYPPKSRDYNWQHSAGRVCFERTIDSDYYILHRDNIKVPAIPDGIPN